MSTEDLRRGEDIVRKLLGDDYFKKTRIDAPQNSRTELLHLADEVIFGKVYTREGLDLRTRSLCTIAALTALGKPEQLRPHIAGALNIGTSEKAIVEVIFQMAVYAGWPAGLNGLAVAEEVFQERKK